jgi:hypothetical protein
MAVDESPSPAYPLLAAASNLRILCRRRATPPARSLSKSGFQVDFLDAEIAALGGEIAKQALLAWAEGAAPVSA